MKPLLIPVLILLTIAGKAQDLIISTTVTLKNDTTVRNLIITPTGVLTKQANIAVTGNISNSGKMYDVGGTLIFAGDTLQTVDNGTDYKGLYINNTNIYKANARFGNITVNNPTKPIAVRFNFGDGVIVDGAVLIAGKLTFIKGIIDIGINNQFMFRLTGQVIMQGNENVGILRGGYNWKMGGQIGKEFPTGSSTFIYPFVDQNYNYSPLVFTMTGNTMSKRWFNIDCFNKKFPYLKSTDKDYLKKYWWIVCTSVNTGTFTAALDFQYHDSDVTGSDSMYNLSSWDGGKFLPLQSASKLTPNHIYTTITPSTLPTNKVCYMVARK